MNHSKWEKLPINKQHSKEFNLERFHHTVAASRNVMIVFGGKDSSGKVCDNQLLEFHFPTATWTSIQTIGLAPCPRWGHSITSNG